MLLVQMSYHDSGLVQSNQLKSLVPPLCRLSLIQESFISISCWTWPFSHWAIWMYCYNWLDFHGYWRCSSFLPAKGKYHPTIWCHNSSQETKTNGMGELLGKNDYMGKRKYCRRKTRKTDADQSWRNHKEKNNKILVKKVRPPCFVCNSQKLIHAWSEAGNKHDISAHTTGGNMP